MPLSLRTFVPIIALAFASQSYGAAAQDREVPYWASIRASEMNMRVGPSADYKIKWVYRRAGLPVKVVRVHEGWRLIQDPDGATGWVVARLLSPERTGIVVGEGLAAVRGSASEEGELRWRLEPGVVGDLGDCDDGWCEMDIDGRRGWVRENRIWGTDAD
ncbi:SH3 domain-containing protein [Qipengyuania spongiae]|uniref:SH3b domain-containing protein n=1 Tax=Qipengyuania spongiae TaxID=2909673 RepID=A0ABY5SWP2_9SPHN|nr:SH3 domain-containing protein [Qipengyuania spongiae]UVI38967.1 hypothetical protein L1F33_12090 [Qipengyuania spongiae]